MEHPFFSIVLATYNRAHLLDRAIDSVLAQSFQDWELLVVDDGSTDHSQIFLKKFEKENRIKVLLKTHSGLSNTRNYALPFLKGNYCCFLDSDDCFKPSHLQQHAELLQNFHYDFLHGKVETIGNVWLPDMNDNSKTINIEDCPAHAGALFIKSDLLIKVGGFPVVDYAEDRKLYDLLLTLNLKHCETNFRTYIYNREEADSITNKMYNRAANSSNRKNNSPQGKC